jgi:hypothetical protein
MLALLVKHLLPVLQFCNFNIRVKAAALKAVMGSAIAGSVILYFGACNVANASPIESVKLYQYYII